jgi:hypothetical protein
VLAAPEAADSEVIPKRPFMQIFAGQINSKTAQAVEEGVNADKLTDRKLPGEFSVQMNPCLKERTGAKT